MFATTQHSSQLPSSEMRLCYSKSMASFQNTRPCQLRLLQHHKFQRFASNFGMNASSIIHRQVKFSSFTRISFLLISTQFSEPSDLIVSKVQLLLPPAAPLYPRHERMSKQPCPDCLTTFIHAVNQL